MQSSDWPVEAIHPNEKNPRRDIHNDPAFPGLVASIKSQGIIQPLLINKDGMILAGHRRYAAAVELNLERVPVRVVPDKNNHTLVPLIENLQRANLSRLELADYLLACREEHGLNAPTIAEIVGVSVWTVRNYQKLALAPPELRDRVDREEISMDTAFAMMSHGGKVLPEVINDPAPTRETVRQRAKEITGWGSARAPHPSTIRSSEMSRRCPCELRPHLEYAIRAVQELLEAAPNDDYAVKYRRWKRTLEDDLYDLSGDDIPQSFAGSVSAFQRPPKAASAK